MNSHPSPEARDKLAQELERKQKAIMDQVLELQDDWLALEEAKKGILLEGNVGVSAE